MSNPDATISHDRIPLRSLFDAQRGERRGGNFANGVERVWLFLTPRDSGSPGGEFAKGLLFVFMKCELNWMNPVPEQYLQN